MAGESTTYDEVPYESVPIDVTHPSRIAAAARVMGMKTAPVDQCRFLEIGCSTGGNLIAMAVNLPNSEFVGIDLSSVQIAAAQKTVDELALTNVRLHAMSITDITPEFGQFDYIVTHGVYSWIPQPVREKLLAVCSENLAPHGVAYVSYNIFPGWHMRGMIRSMMRYHCRNFDSAPVKVQQARMLLDFLVGMVNPPDSAYGMLLKGELEVLQKSPDYYLLHEQLEDINEPCYFHEFVQAAGRHDLQYVGEANLQIAQLAPLSAAAAGILQRVAADAIEREQYLDFIRNGTFRRTLLTHRSVGLAERPDRSAIDDLYIQSLARPESPHADVRSRTAAATYSTRDGKAAITTRNVLTKAAFHVLAEHAPRPLVFGKLHELCLAVVANEKCKERVEISGDDEAAMREDLLRCAAHGLVVLFSHVPACVRTPGPRPTAGALARIQARVGGRVTNQLHQYITVDDFARHLIPLLDGTRHRRELQGAMMEVVLSGKLPYRAGGQVVADKGRIRRAVEEGIEGALKSLAASAVLVA